MEDVLPFLPDFVTIDTFKEEIVSALTVYSEKIKRYKAEVAECDLTCDSLMEEIDILRSTPVKCPRNAICALSNKPLLRNGKPVRKGENFYVFPSGYVVSGRALREAIFPSLSEGQKRRVEQIEEELAGLGGDFHESEIVSNTSFGGAKKKIVYIEKRLEEKEEERTKMDELHEEYDKIVAAECPLTGKIMVESIIKPLPGWNDDLK